MAKTEHYFTKLEEGKYYHIYNRSVDRKPMFKNEGNYKFFLKKYDKYLSPVLETHVFCLLINHFHFLIKVKDLTTFKKLSNLNPEIPAYDIVSDHFKKFFQSYSMAFNKQNNRIGTLFQTPFKRALIESDNHLRELIYFIHANPQLHKQINDFKNWKWSSFKGILSDKPSKLNKKGVLELFGGNDRYLEFHLEKQKLIYPEKYFIEDEI